MENFDTLIQQLRQGDTHVATELLRRFEPEVRRFVRFRLTSPSLRRFIDSLDISQSVFAKFFVEFGRGNVNVQSPEQMRNLLLTMARNKIYDQARHEQAARRDVRRREISADGLGEQLADPSETPSVQLAAAEIVEAVTRRLSREDQYLVQQRMGGRPWRELAKELKSTAEALRKRMSRAIDRAAREAGVIS